VPHTLGDLGLVESIRELADSITRTQALKINLSVSELNEERIPENKQLMLFRIIQEQLNNIVKHAQALRVQINLHRTPSALLLEIKDDGTGFDPVKTRKGLGLTNIRNRVELFNGSVAIDSAPGKGCTLRVTIPPITAQPAGV
jgi:two-component system sensor histidine kinase UhpB